MALVSGTIAEKANSSGGMVWATARDEAELVEDSGLVIGEQDQIDGGFSSLDGMLHWAIGKIISPSHCSSSLIFLLDLTLLSPGRSLGSCDVEGSS